MTAYDHRSIEAKWQDRWDKSRVAEIDLRAHGSSRRR